MVESVGLRHPVMIAAFEGWNDAGDAATAAIEHLNLAWGATEFADLDPDCFYDFQVVRPTVSMVDGVSRRLEWPTTHLTACRLPDASHDALLVRGIEPNYRWRAFGRELVRIAMDCDVSMVVTLGALMADVAHTTPIQISGSADDEATAERLSLAQSQYEGPTGITGVLQDALVQAGIPSVSLWAAVPHYVSSPPSPKATLALLRRVEEVIDAAVPVGDFPERAADWVDEVSRLAAEDSEVSGYVHELQERDEGTAKIEPVSGERLAQDFERYLRRRQ